MPPYTTMDCLKATAVWLCLALILTPCVRMIETSLLVESNSNT